MPSAEFETVIPASNRPQSSALDGANTGIGEGIPFWFNHMVF